MEMEMSTPVMLVTAGFFMVFIVLAVANQLYRRLKIEHYGDRYVLITGCDTGFGYRCARKLDSLGFHVFAGCLTQEKVLELSSSCSKRMLAIQMDVTNNEDVQRSLDTVKSHLPHGKGLWAVVNNAGIVGPVGLCDWLSKSHFQVALDVNVMGMVLVTQAFLPLVRLTKGRIINTASVLGRVAFSSAPYTVSKFCVEAFTDCLRREVWSTGVTVHTVEPGGYQTNITDSRIVVGSMRKNFDALDSELKTFYGPKYAEKLAKMAELVCYAVSSRNLDQVVDTYVNVVTAKYPKTRYVVGLNGNILFRSMWSLPTWLIDFLLGMPYPLPRGL